MSGDGYVKVVPSGEEEREREGGDVRNLSPVNLLLIKSIIVWLDYIRSNSSSITN